MKKKNVVIVMADALRADRISKTGYRRDGKKTTPNIDKIAERGSLFERAYATGGWTADSQPAFLTGNYCSKMDFPGRGNPLEEEYGTLGSLFSEHGYETRSYNLSLHIRKELGFSKGFDYYEDIPLKKRFELDFWHLEGMAWNALKGRDDRTRYGLKSIKRWLRKRDEEQPFFLFWNPTNPHNKYEAPKGPWKELERDVGPDMDEEAIEKVADWGTCMEYMTGEIDLTDDEMDVVESRYDACVRYLDYRVGQLVDQLKEKEVYEDTVFIFTSDHGENFGEYNRLLYHGFGLNESLVHVPLVVEGLDVEEENMKTPSSLLDIFNSLNKELFDEQKKDIDSKSNLFTGEPRDKVFFETRSTEGGKIERIENSYNPPKPIEWYKSQKRGVVKQNNKLVKLEEGFESFLVEGLTQKEVEKLNNQEELLDAVDATLPKKDTEKKEVNEEIKKELEKLGYT